MRKWSFSYLAQANLPETSSFLPVINSWFDAARSYGEAESFLSGWLQARGLHGKVTVSSKWGYTYTADFQVCCAIIQAIYVHICVKTSSDQQEYPISAEIKATRSPHNQCIVLESLYLTHIISNFEPIPSCAMWWMTSMRSHSTLIVYVWLSLTT